MSRKKGAKSDVNAGPTPKVCGKKEGEVKRERDDGVVEGLQRLGLQTRGTTRVVMRP